MTKKIVIIVNVLIGLALGGLFVWFQARRGAAGFRHFAERMGVLAVIALAQQEYQREAVRDEDKDGIGEYGALEELFRSDAGNPSYVEAIFRRYFKSTPPFGERFVDWSLQGDGTVETGDYIYAVFLPDTADGREKNWCVFAHPCQFTRETSQTYFLEGSDITHAYFTVYEGYTGPRRGPAPDRVYEGTPFDSGVREYRMSSESADGSNPFDEKKMRRAVAKVRKSEGTLWIRCRVAYPKGAGGQKQAMEQK
ncbi:MAG: hypothetical protein GXP25_08050 [Planctomycetes bacterium]|nr:hypothetical protein [Planctomycetota bacterium]